MYNCSKIHRYQYVINQGGHPIALVSMVTTLCEKSLFRSCARGPFANSGQFFDRVRAGLKGLSAHAHNACLFKPTTDSLLIHTLELAGVGACSHQRSSFHRLPRS